MIAALVGALVTTTAVLFAGNFFGRRASSLGTSSMHLDPPSIESRIIWCSDLVSVVALVVSGSTLATVNLVDGDASAIGTVLAILVVMLSIALLILIARLSAAQVNGYPAAFYDRLPPRLERLTVPAKLVQPGFAVTVLGEVILVVCAVALR